MKTLPIGIDSGCGKSKVRSNDNRVREIKFCGFRRPYIGKFPFLINLVDKIINRFPSLERFSPLIGGIYEIRCVMEKDAAKVDLTHTDGAKIDD